jgi:release factor glutamine methyltransferase
MNIKEALLYTQKALHDYSDSARIDAELLILKVFNWPKSKLFSHADTVFSESQVASLNHFIQFRQNHVPIPHILGYKEFWSLRFDVSLATLIPRPATESLVAYILEHYTKPECRVLDLGTGSGAIAISLATERPNWDITAVDLNPAALAMASKNAARHQCQHIRFCQSNWFSRLCGQQFDIIISNPPYIDEQDLHLTQGDVQHEPKLALTSGANGYTDLIHLINHSKHHLNPEGVFVLEHGYQQQEQVMNYLHMAGFQHVSGHQDLDHLSRFCVAY